ncbi:MAG: hypothetical protein IJA97_01615 [Clostridia bacterium]|nr:hypothetical protein [Clostridia bacterium]
MIRDEFLKQQKEKKLSAKELEKIRQMGERPFYTNQISRLSSLKKTVDLSTIIVGIFLAITTATIVAIIILAGEFLSSLIAPVAVISVFWLVILSWYLVIRPILKKKLAKYMVELDRVRKEDLEKQQKIYAKIKK